jgi:hypothetical protein
MSVAVPIVIGVALAVSLYGQAVRTWPNYASEQNEKPEKQDESKDKSDKKPSEKGKSGQGNSSEDKAGNPTGVHHRLPHRKTNATPDRKAGNDSR